MTTLSVRLRELRELRDAVAALGCESLWLDDNNPWRIMKTCGGMNFAIAEEHPESVIGDGKWKDGDAICKAINAALKIVPELDTILSAISEREWRPIETAPKDGTVVLGLNAKKFTRIRETWWFAPSSMTQEWLCRERPGSWHPTHWTPLPAPPAPSAQGEE